MSKKVTVTVKMNEPESKLVREYCRGFDENMPDLLAKLILYAMANAPVVNTGVALDLGTGRLIMARKEPRTLRGCRPGNKNKRA